MELCTMLCPTLCSTGLLTVPPRPPMQAPPGRVRVLTYVYDFDSATKAKAAPLSALGATIVSTKVWCTGVPL